LNFPKMLELNLQRAVLKDRYEIRGRISSGSYAEVFVARDRSDGNVVVIKALNSHLQGTPYPELEEMLDEKFQSESAILEEIRHGNIVSVIDQGDDEDNTGRGFSFIVLEFMPGGNLIDQHTLPRGCAKVRYYGIWSPSCRAQLEQARTLLSTSTTTKAVASAPDTPPPEPALPSAPARCPLCGIGQLRLVQALPPQRKLPP
jgi:hypothetical protein